MLQSSVKKILRWLWPPLIIGVLYITVRLAIVMREHNYDSRAIAKFMASVFVLLSFPLTFYSVTQHLSYFSKPKQQLRIIRVLFMVPIYGVDSLLALYFKETVIVFHTLRECYEAYTLYNFFEYLLAYLSECGDVGRLLSTHLPTQRHLWPLHRLRPWVMGPEFMAGCRAGIMNYVILRPVTTITTLVCVAAGTYGHGQLNFRVAYPYLALVNSLSQSWALYCLVLFYAGTRSLLAPIRPLAKFGCIKFVVFFSFWQGVALSLLVRVGVIRDPGPLSAYDREDIAVGIQDFLITFEMLVAAVAHTYAFSANEFKSEQLQGRPWRDNWRDVVHIADVRSDVYTHVVSTVVTTHGKIIVASSELVSSAGELLDTQRAKLSKAMGKLVKKGPCRAEPDADGSTTEAAAGSDDHERQQDLPEPTEVEIIMTTALLDGRSRQEASDSKEPEVARIVALAEDEESTDEGKVEGDNVHNEPPYS